MPKAAPRYLLIAAMLLLLVNHPLLSTANKMRLISGIPLLYLYIGCVWVLSIVLLYITTRQIQKESDE